MRDWKALGVTFSRPDSLYLSPATLLAQHDGALDRVVLVPMAHLYANPEFAGALDLTPAQARARVRRENAWVAAAAARHADRAVALCSVPALADWALTDLVWCRDSLRVAGIKLHLASSQVDLRDSTHLARLATIAAFAETNVLPLLLHVDPQRRGHDSTHVRALAERVFGPFPNLTVVVAHLGCSGGYGPWTRTVFRTLRRWRTEAERNGPTRSLYFDLSAVVLEEESEGVPATSDAELALLRDDLRADGLDRVLLGSDYPVFDPLRTFEVLRTRVGLTDDELSRLSRAPGPRWRRGREPSTG